MYIIPQLVFCYTSCVQLWDWLLYNGISCHLLAVCGNSTWGCNTCIGRTDITKVWYNIQICTSHKTYPISTREIVRLRMIVKWSLFIVSYTSIHCAERWWVSHCYGRWSFTRLQPLWRDEYELRNWIFAELKRLSFGLYVALEAAELNDKSCCGVQSRTVLALKSTENNLQNLTVFYI